MHDLKRNFQPADQKIVRQLNKGSIIDLIRRSAEGISRAEIAQLLRVSRSTASIIVDDLLTSGLVIERGAGVSRGGRRPIVLEINPAAGYVVGVDIGATHVLVIVADFFGKVLTESEASFAIADGPETCLPRVQEMAERAVREIGQRWSSVKAVGVGVPGPVDINKGIVSAPPIMPGWDGFPIRQYLAERWSKPTSLDNDADLGALGEWSFGAGQGESNLAYIKVGTGIGCGILIDGQIYHGVLGTAGEIGHVTISEDGSPCTCGNYGCLEAMAGGRAIAQRAQMAVKAGQRTTLTDLLDHEVTARDVALAAAAGDVVSQQLLSDAGRHIGSALASLINLLNPGLVLIGGGVAEAGGFLLNPLRVSVNERSLRASLRAARIAVAALGRRSTALGAVSLALATTFQQYIEPDETRRVYQPHLGAFSI
jgi:glucokinase-like ROK family protein